MSTTAALRSPMLPLARRVRAYFAPVERASGTPAVFDPGRQGWFDAENPPTPWVPGGQIENFVRMGATKIQQAHAGAAGATMVQYRSLLEARVEFDFRQWGKLQMAVSGGAEQFNVLAPQSAGTSRPCGGDAVSAVPLQAGSTATELQLNPSQLPGFTVGDMVAVDVDYQGQTGYVGSGIAAAFVQDSAGHDVNYVRRVSFNVGRVAEKTGSSLKLAQPLLGGAPVPGAAVQKVTAFVDHEGGSFFQEWSALFVIPEEGGGRVCFYYPRVQSAAPMQEKSVAVADWLHGYALHASLVALAYRDPEDEQPVVCYRSYLPTGAAAVY